ncbi:sensor histidine kinase [uncultured Jatrophihabitans sp.]|uniref:sensor histidine kinase n=1 Tax=uncultured Jatrophihabitans sp. TaxID=1610747 RepID=UPI0035CA04FB
MVALITLVLVAVGVGTYFTLRSSLENRLDDQVMSAAGQNAAYFGRGCQQSSSQSDIYTCRRPDGPQSSGAEWVALLDPNDGSVVATISQGGPIMDLDLTAAQRQQLTERPLQIIDASEDGHSLRVTARTNNIGLLVVTGLPTDEVDGTLSRLIGREVVIGIAAILVAVLATSWGVRLSLRRLRRVTVTAQEVAAELSPEGAGLDRRVPDDEPETEVGQLATSFNTMLAAVETQFAARLESEHRMRQFMADASHELRTPLTSIRGYAELARMQRRAGDTSDDNLDRIESEGTRMSRLVEDLLMLARGDADGTDRQGRRELLEVADVVDDSVRGAQAAFPQREIVMDPVPDAYLIGDRDQLVRVIRNLVTNAAVHTAVERPIRVRAWGDGPSVVLQVVDGGPGLAPEDAAHVFERFWRADKARTRARGGSGLGLSIVATIVRAHGGTVRFDSTVEGGSTVTVTLPAAHSASDEDWAVAD